MHCLSCLKVLWTRRPTQSNHRSILPISHNNSTFNSSLLPSANQEVVALMSQVQKSRRSSCASFRSTKSGISVRRRRNREMSQSHFLRIVEKRKKTERISRKAFELYREVAGVLILGEQLRVQTRRTPPLPAPMLERKRTM